MREHPILFSGPMVKAILAGTKTQTRRVIMPHPGFTPEIEEKIREGGTAEWRNEPFSSQVTQAWKDGWVDVRSPYGLPGDRLWVRETWKTSWSLDDLSPAQIATKAVDAGWHEPWAPVRYMADGREVNWDISWGPPGKTRVSIHMPRWASRLTLEITEVRVQRLQEISEEDARAEGVEAAPFCKAGRPPGMEHVESFEDLWNSLNGERPGCSWEANPWAWAISFKRVEQSMSGPSDTRGR